jgi:hypothetical protein
VQILQEHGITPCLWAKDVLYFNGIWARYTCLGDLCILVPDQDLETAAKIISSLRYWPLLVIGTVSDHDVLIKKEVLDSRSL